MALYIHKLPAHKHTHMLYIKWLCSSLIIQLLWTYVKEIHNSTWRWFNWRIVRCFNYQFVNLEKFYIWVLKQMDKKRWNNIIGLDLFLLVFPHGDLLSYFMQQKQAIEKISVIKWKHLLNNCSIRMYSHKFIIKLFPKFWWICWMLTFQ